METTEFKNIKLNKPNRTGGLTIQEAFANRRGKRVDFDGRKLSEQQLADLLWSANGVNNPEGRRTVPSALDSNDIDVYVIMEDAAYLYDPDKQELIRIADGDYRKATAGGQDFVVNAPVILILVSDYSRYENNHLGVDISEFVPALAAMDAGMVSQNINLFCAGNGLNTITRARMDMQLLQKVLKLSDSQHLLLNNAVGYPVE